MDTENKRFTRKGKRRMLFAFAADIVALGAFLIVFALFHHVTDWGKEYETPISVSVPTPQPAAETPAPATAAPDASATPEATLDPNIGTWGARFADKFTDGEPVLTELSYTGRDVSIEITKTSENSINYYVADIYIRNIDNFLTAFASGTFETRERMYPWELGEQHGALLTIAGDFCQLHDKSIVVRNGVVYRTKPNSDDVLALYYDGTMETYSASEFDMDAAVAKGIYQAWAFGPTLLKDGKAISGFTGDLAEIHPRCAIGYYEPGHYCFVVVDGRKNGGSIGMTLDQLSELFERLGCTKAYNMDGGASAALVFNNEIINVPHDGGRRTSDIIFIKEVNAE